MYAMLYPCIHPCNTELLTAAIICVCRSMSTVLSALAWCGAGGWWLVGGQGRLESSAAAPASQHQPGASTNTLLCSFCVPHWPWTLGQGLANTESAEFLGYPDTQPLIPRTVINAPPVRRGDVTWKYSETG